MDKTLIKYIKMNVKNILTITLLLTTGLFFVNAQTSDETEGIAFSHGTFEQAKALAKKENKLVFVDAFTTWCGPCKMMAKRVFVEKSVGEFYNANFVNMKIDMESSEGLNFGKQYKVSGYPTFLFIDGSGKLVSVEMGMVDANTFIGFGEKALKNHK
jgi:thiol:disulfide interchange protein